MGKNLGDDLREGKVTLPLIIAMQRGTAEQCALIRNAIEVGETDNLPAVIEIVKTTGALDATRQAAAAQAQLAIDAIANLTDNAYTRGLLQLAASLLDRRI